MCVYGHYTRLNDGYCQIFSAAVVVAVFVCVLRPFLLDLLGAIHTTRFIVTEARTRIISYRKTCSLHKIKINFKELAANVARLFQRHFYSHIIDTNRKRLSYVSKLYAI